MPVNIQKQHQGHSSWHLVRLQSGGSGKLDPESSRRMIENGFVCAPNPLLGRKAICADEIVDQKKANMSNFPVGHQNAAWQGWALLMLRIAYVHLRNENVSEYCLCVYVCIFKFIFKFIFIFISMYIFISIHCIFASV